MTQKSKWTDRIFHPIQVLNHSDGLHLEKFTEDDLEQIAGCDDVYEIHLRSNRTAKPVDLSRLAHIRGLRQLHLERVQFTNLQALRALPYLRFVTIEQCAFMDLQALNGFGALTTLFLRRNKIQRFPAGLDVPQLDCLHLTDERITDLSFAASYPCLKDLDVGHNQITDLSSLAGCTSLEMLDVGNNPVATLAPLAGRRFKRLHVNSVLHGEKAALQLELPEQPYEQDADSAETSRVAHLMQAKDWSQVYAITDCVLLGKAFSYVIHERADAEMIRGALAHPKPGAFESMIAHGLRPHYSYVLELVVDIFSEFGERLIPPMALGLQVALQRARFLDPFHIGKLDSDHFTIARILQKVSGPAYTELFLTFFALREDFSQLHLRLYKLLLDAVGKTQSPELVEPLIDLLRFEKHIIGGDPAFMKKIFKAIGQLGTKADAAVMASRFDVSAEARTDVAEAYEATLKKLEKKKS